MKFNSYQINYWKNRIEAKLLSLLALPLELCSKTRFSSKTDLFSYQDVVTYLDELVKNGKSDAKSILLYSGSINIYPPFYIGEPSKEADLKKLVSFTDEFVFAIPRCYCFHKDFILITESGHFINRLSHFPDTKPNSHYVFKKRKFLPAKHLPGKTLLVRGATSGNFSHFMLEGIVSIFLAKQAGYDLTEFDHFYIWHNTRPFVKYYLNKLGIPSEKIVSTNNNLQAVYSDVLVTTTYHDHVGTWLPRAFDDIRPNMENELLKNKKIPLRLFVSRKKAQMRHIINENEVVRQLRHWGFISICNEDYTLNQQALLFQEAECVISLHGANLTNIVFCRPNTHIIELRYRDHTAHFKKTYWQISVALGLNYKVLYCKAGCDLSKELADYGNVNADILVNLQDLEKMMQMIFRPSN